MEWSHSVTQLLLELYRNQACKKRMDADCWRNGQQRLQAYMAGVRKEIPKHERHI